MLRSLSVALLATVAALPAAAQTSSFVPGFSAETNQNRIVDQATPYITTVRQGDLFNPLALAGNSQFRGVGGLFIQPQGGTGGGTICSGSLISSTLILTAAHCLGGTNIRTIDFYLPDYADATASTVFRANGWALHPDYDDVENVLGGNDLAIIRLGREATGFEIYDIYTDGAEFAGVHTKVGTGTIGVGATGTFLDAINFDGDKRFGSNLYEYSWDEIVGSTDGVVDDIGGAPVGSILMFDMDSGTAAEDLFGRLGGNAQRGVTDGAGRVRDVNSSPGDSGGPTFIGGRIAGITSFGITGNAFEPLAVNCGDPTSVDQSFDLETGACTNSSFGEMSGDTRVGYFADWVNLYRSGAGVFQTAVPEPATWATMIAGFAMIGAGLRRRRPTRVVA